jgi:1,2-diacylglycerol 3-alpha-glucosyltransferase
MPERRLKTSFRVAVIWIDWYPYHVARFRGIEAAPTLSGRVVGIELVGGIGVHAGLKFRESLPEDLAIETLLPNTSWREASHLQLARMLWRRLSQLNPEVVLVPGYYTLPAIAAAVWARLHGAASVLMTESTAGDHQRTSWKETLKSVGMRVLFGWAVSGGRAHVDYLDQLGFAHNRIFGFYDVVDNDFFSSGTSKLRTQHDVTQGSFGLPSSPYFLYVGRLAKEKNVSTLLRSWVAYRQTGGSWPLVLVGDGPESQSLKSIAAASPYAEDVIFTGLRSSRELLPFYAFAGCFVLPSTREPWGLVVNEAMASALPILVSTHCGCAPDLLSPGLNGFAFDPTDANDLSRLLMTIAALTTEQRATMGSQSASIISHFSPARFGSSIASIVDHASTPGGFEPVQGGTR